VGEQAIGTPPAAVRATALPPRAKRDTGPAGTGTTLATPKPQAAGPSAPADTMATAPMKTMSAGPATPPLRVRVTSGADEGWLFALSPGELIIGREEGSAIRLQDGNVSHQHALLRVHGEDVTIEDLRSTNGTKVNGVAIDSPADLAPGDVIDVGGVQLVIEENQAAKPEKS
jgi:pSer/pThr/pTyr-binding forkhead associated (FHA) protein